MENNAVSPLLGKTILKILGTKYAYEKAVILRKSLPGLDPETRQIFGDILNRLESNSIDEHDEYWGDFDKKLRGMFLPLASHNVKRNRFKQSRVCSIHELIIEVYTSLRDKNSKEPSAKEVRKELENNHRNFKNHEIIQEFTDEKICWISKWYYEQDLKWESFPAVLSKLKKRVNGNQKH